MTWTTVDLGTTSDPFYKIHFKDANNGFISSITDHYRTTDGGETWTLITDIPSGSWYHIDFVSQTAGFYGGGGALARSVDGGATWQLRSAYPNCPQMYGMDSRDSNFGLVGGEMVASNEPGIFKTSDDGTTWIRKFPQSANDVIWIDSTTAIAIVGIQIYRSVDSGESWSPFSVTSIDSGLDDLQLVSGSTVVGVSGKGDIWRSTDGGLFWQLVSRGLGDLPASWSVSFSDPSHGWVVGQSGFVYKSIDGGATWQQVNNGLGTQIYQIEMATDTLGFAAGENGYVLRTRDAGLHWDVSKVEVTGQVFGRDESLRAVSVVDSQYAVVAGPGGTVFKTADGGDSWQNIGYPNLPNMFWIEDVKFVSRDEGWVVGSDQDYGHTKTIYHTTNGGATWTLIPNGGGRMASVDFVDAAHGWVLFGGGRIWCTTNGGTSWVEAGLYGYWTTPNVDEIKFANQSTGWVVGWDGIVAKSTNGGLTWAFQSVGRTDVHFFSIVIRDANRVTIAGRLQDFTPVVYETQNGGATWVQVSGPTGQYEWFVGMAAAPNGNLIGVGYRSIYRRAAPLQDIVPTSYAVVRGTSTSGNLASLAFNDADRLSVRPGITLNASEAPIQVVVEGIALSGSITDVRFDLVARADESGLGQTIQLYDWVAGQYETVDSRAAGTADAAIEIVATNPAHFVQAGTRALRAKVSYRAIAPLLHYPYVAQINQTIWKVGT